LKKAISRNSELNLTSQNSRIATAFTPLTFGRLQ
jgi:hypothetical protein